jgi:hypothetical protein
MDTGLPMRLEDFEIGRLHEARDVEQLVRTVVSIPYLSGRGRDDPVIRLRDKKEFVDMRVHSEMAPEGHNLPCCRVHYPQSSQ